MADPSVMTAADLNAAAGYDLSGLASSAPVATAARDQAVTARDQSVAAAANLSGTLVPAKNKFNASGATLANSQISSTGAVQTNAGFAFTLYTDYIPISASTTYVSNNASNVQISWYDAAKAWISNANVASTVPVVSPANAAFARYTVSTGITASGLQIEVGSAATIYEAFRLVVSNPALSAPDVMSLLQALPNMAGPIARGDILLPGKNKFNSGGQFLTTYQFSASGALQTNAAWTDRRAYLEYIPISPNTTYVSNNATGATIVWYDSAKAIIGAASYTIASSAPKVSPANAAFYRVSLFPASIDPTTFQIEAASVSTAYEAYKLVVSATALPALVTALYGDGSIIPAKTSFMAAGKNIFNANGTVLANARFNAANGNVQTNASFTTVVYTDFIPTVPLTSYVSNNALGASIVWYDANYAVIGATSYTIASTVPLTSPAGTAFMRVSFDPNSITASTFQIEAGIFPTFYEPFGYVAPTPTGKQVATALKWAANILAVPSKLRLLKGVENSIYYRYMQRRSVRDLFYTRLMTTADATALVGGVTLMNRERYARVTPTATGTTTIKASLYDGELDELDRKTTSVIVTDPATPSAAFTYLQIGDSFTWEGHYLQKMRSLLTGLTLLGIRRVTPVGSTISGNPPVNHEGRSGWALSQYFTQMFSASFTGFTPFMQPVDPYKYFGNTATWKDVYSGSPSSNVNGLNFVGDVKGFSATTGYPTSPNTNDVVYDDALALYKVWDGTAWQTITAATLGFTFNFTKYGLVWGIAVPNAVGVMLGGNEMAYGDVRAVPTIYAGYKANMDTLIASVKAAGVAKIVMMLQPASGPMDAYEGIRFTRKSDAAMWEVRRLNIANYDNREAEGIYLCDFGTSVDDKWGWGFQVEEKPFADYAGTQTETMFGNLPHPSRDGYYQGGIRLAATIQAIR